ncbi:MAG: GNAT family N-acetyltransferase [Desulfobacteraceae bacterium]|nr:MAG: GNAT family N-acetyltransferase [Desulfobacteraceae bacterium]
MDIDIAPFDIELYDDVFTLWQQCEGVGLSDADSRPNIQLYLERNPGMSFVALFEGKIVGVVLAGHDGRRGYIHHLAVHPGYRRKGLARRLVGCCLSVLAVSGIQKCHLFIFNDNHNGIEFWKSTGWTYRSEISVVSKNIEPGASLRHCL